MVGFTKGDNNRRQRRVAESIRAELSKLLIRSVSDPRLALVTITEVNISPDLKNSTVYFVAPKSEDKAKISKAFVKSSIFLQREIGQTLKLRNTPKLLFKYDNSFDKGSRVDQLIFENEKELKTKKSNESPEQSLARLISENSKILLCVHANPDGDAIGSLLGMAAILNSSGKQPVAYCPDGIPQTLQFLPGSDQIVTKLEHDEKFEITIIMDTGGIKLWPSGFPEESKRGVLIVIDHHMTFEDFGDVVIRREVSSTGELLFSLAKQLLWIVNKDAAQCLYTSIVADTGSFRYSSTTAKTFEIAANLVKIGAEPWRTATELFESVSVGRQKLLGKVVSTLYVSKDDVAKKETNLKECYADLFCTQEMLINSNATKSDLDGMINLGRSIENVAIAAMFRVELDGKIKISFRSKGRIDVAALASNFGGGGHKNAAGASLTDTTLEDAQKIIRHAALQLLE